LPLHYGKAPAWLFGRMKNLSREIAVFIVKENGVDDFLAKLSDPFWFQAFGCVLGFDWHSSGLTTTVCGALKEGLRDESEELGVFVCGGKGATSRKTPEEIDEIGQKRLIDTEPEDLIYASRMSAKVDSAALQDGYDLYHHSFIFSKKGDWCVIQQGMNTKTLWARRYHWLSKKVYDFVNEPHEAICCDSKNRVLNMVARESRNCRNISAMLASEKPKKVTAEFVKIKELNMSGYHTVSLGDIKKRNLEKILEKTYEVSPCDFENLLNIRGVGRKTIRALSLISELIYNSPASIEDPVRFSFAHGGKDGHPYPVNKSEYDLSIQILRDALNHANIGRTEKIKALRRLYKNFV